MVTMKIIVRCGPSGRVCEEFRLRDVRWVAILTVGIAHKVGAQVQADLIRWFHKPFVAYL